MQRGEVRERGLAPREPGESERESVCVCICVCMRAGVGAFAHARERVCMCMWMRMLSQASPVPPHLKRGSYEKPPSPPSPALQPSYSQIVKTKKPPRDPEKQARDPKRTSRDVSHDPPVPSRSHDQTCDQTQSCVQTQSPDPPHFGRTTHPLIGTWQTVETKQQSTRSSGIPHSLSQWILELVMPLSV